MIAQSTNYTIADVKELAAKLVDEMPGWEVVKRADDYDCRHGFSIIKVGKSHQRLWVRVANASHYEVSPSWPFHKSHTYLPQRSDGLAYVPDQVRISKTKTLAQVAKEIDRRLLASYLPAADAMQKKVERERSNDDTRTAVLAELCELSSHREPSEYDIRNGESESFREVICKINVSHDGSTARLSFGDLSIDAARELIALASVIKAKHPLPVAND